MGPAATAAASPPGQLHRAGRCLTIPPPPRARGSCGTLLSSPSIGSTVLRACRFDLEPPRAPRAAHVCFHEDVP